MFTHGFLFFYMLVERTMVLHQNLELYFNLSIIHAELWNNDVSISLLQYLFKVILPSVFVYSSPTFYCSKFDHLFFLLKNLRYFNVYNTNEVCSIKNHICENLMYLKIFCRKKRMVKIATVKIRWQVNENGGSTLGAENDNHSRTKIELLNDWDRGSICQYTAYSFCCGFVVNDYKFQTRIIFFSHTNQSAVLLYEPATIWTSQPNMLQVGYTKSVCKFVA